MEIDQAPKRSSSQPTPSRGTSTTDAAVCFFFFCNKRSETGLGSHIVHYVFHLAIQGAIRVSLTISDGVWDGLVGLILDVQDV
jgi:hypothetical protein